MKKFLLLLTCLASLLFSAEEFFTCVSYRSSGVWSFPVKVKAFYFRSGAELGVTSLSSFVAIPTQTDNILIELDEDIIDPKNIIGDVLGTTSNGVRWKLQNSYFCY